MALCERKGLGQNRGFRRNPLPPMSFHSNPDPAPSPVPVVPKQTHTQVPTQVVSQHRYLKCRTQFRWLQMEQEMG